MTYRRGIFILPIPKKEEKKVVTILERLARSLLPSIYLKPVKL